MENDEMWLHEYSANIELWKHDDTLRQQRHTTFITVETIIMTIVAAVVSLREADKFAFVTISLFCLVGFALSFVWAKIQIRNGAYVRFRRYQLRRIEKHLNHVVTTISNQSVALDSYKSYKCKSFQDRRAYKKRQLPEVCSFVGLHGKSVEFVLKKKEMVSATDLDIVIPIVMAAFWVLGFMLSICWLIFIPHA